MNAPWITLWLKIKATVGNDASVRVYPLEGKGTTYVAGLAVPNRRKAVALASLIVPRFEFGNVAVTVDVRDEQGTSVAPTVPGSVDELRDMVEVGLGDNGWYSHVAVKSLLGHPRVFTVFAAAVVQFFNDDLSELYGTFNGVVAEVFAGLLQSELGGQALHCSSMWLSRGPVKDSDPGQAVVAPLGPGGVPIIDKPTA
jgi:hypothetical protein